MIRQENKLLCVHKKNRIPCGYLISSARVSSASAPRCVYLYIIIIYSRTPCFARWKPVPKDAHAYYFHLIIKNVHIIHTYTHTYIFINYTEWWCSIKVYKKILTACTWFVTHLHWNRCFPSTTALWKMITSVLKQKTKYNMYTYLYEYIIIIIMTD